MDFVLSRYHLTAVSLQGFVVLTPNFFVCHCHPTLIRPHQFVNSTTTYWSNVISHAVILLYYIVFIIFQQLSKIIYKCLNLVIFVVSVLSPLISACSYIYKCPYCHI